MTNEKMLSKLYAIVKCLPEDEQKLVEKFSKIEMKKIPFENIVFHLAQAIYELKNDISTETAKKEGKGNALKAAKAILKHGAVIRDVFGYAPIIDGMQYISNGYLMIRLKNPLDLPELPQNLNYVDVSRVFQTTENVQKIELPSVSQLKTYIKTQKAAGNKKTEICLYDGGQFVNAEYLLQIIEILPNASAYANINPLYPIYFKSDEGEAVLMPIRPKDGTTRAKTEL